MATAWHYLQALKKVSDALGFDLFDYASDAASTQTALGSSVALGSYFSTSLTDGQLIKTINGQQVKASFKR